MLDVRFQLIFENIDYEKLKIILSEATQYIKPEPEKTIFSIGGRGHYENPISDVLAFFLNPNEDHGFGKLFIECLFNSLNSIENPQSIDLIDHPAREISTEKGKRLDLLLEGDDWVLIIENKIYHDQVNPFTEFEEFIEKKYKNKRSKIYIVLSPRGESVPAKWIPLSYGQLIEELRISLGRCITENPYNKWIVLLREFILNLEHYAVSSEMDDQAIKLIESNYNDVVVLEEMRKKYIKHLRKEGLALLNKLFPSQKISTVIHAWRDGPAIRFYSESWVEKSNLVLQVSGSGIRIFIYAYEIDGAEIAIADRKLKRDHYTKPKMESENIRCYESGNRHKEYRHALNEFKETAINFNEFNFSRTTNKRMQRTDCT